MVEQEAAKLFINITNAVLSRTMIYLEMFKFLEK